MKRLTVDSQEYHDLMARFEIEYAGSRLDREPKPLWRMNVIYQDGRVNDLFVAYRLGYAFAIEQFQTQLRRFK